MINFSSSSKMWWKFLILSLTIAGIQASGNFYVYNYPKALLFKGTEELDGKNVAEVMKASLGSTVSGNSKWSGLMIVDPFDIPKRAVAVYIDGTDRIHTNEKVKSYPIKGDVEETLNEWSNDLESSNSDIADIDLSQIDEAIVTYTNMFGEIPKLGISMKSNNNLKPDLHSEDKQFLQGNKLLESIATKYEAEEYRKNIMLLRISLLPIAKAHGVKSAAMTEAKKLVADAISNLFETIHKSDDEILLVAIAAQNEGKRFKRAVEPPQPSGKNPLNLAEYYDEDFPVVFNIILWFMVVFAFALLAICYAIGSMDPGRDSIIYRMTSTRMKKDN